MHRHLITIVMDDLCFFIPSMDLWRHLVTVSGESWIALFPGLALIRALFCFNFIGDGLRDIVIPPRRM